MMLGLTSLRAQTEQRLALTGGLLVETNLSGFFHSGVNSGNSKMKPGAGAGGFLNLA